MVHLPRTQRRIGHAQSLVEGQRPGAVQNGPQQGGPALSALVIRQVSEVDLGGSAQHSAHPPVSRHGEDGAVRLGLDAQPVSQCRAQMGQDGDLLVRERLMLREGGGGVSAPRQPTNLPAAHSLTDRVPRVMPKQLAQCGAPAVASQGEGRSRHGETASRDRRVQESSPQPPLKHAIVPVGPSQTGSARLEECSRPTYCTSEWRSTRPHPNGPRHITTLAAQY